MATDYDAPRHGEPDQPGKPAPPALAATPPPSGTTDPGGERRPVEGERALAAVDPTDEELAVPLVPRQFDEFICTSCYLVQPNSLLADPRQRICTDCAG